MFCELKKHFSEFHETRNGILYIFRVLAPGRWKFHLHIAVFPASSRDPSRGLTSSMWLFTGQHPAKRDGGGARPGVQAPLPPGLSLGLSLPALSPRAPASSQPVLSSWGQGGLPPRCRGAQGQPRTLISAESDTRRAESVDIYYCSQESGAPGGSGRGEAREGCKCEACAPRVCARARAREGGGEGRLLGK